MINHYEEKNMKGFRLPFPTKHLYWHFNWEPNEFMQCVCTCKTVFNEGPVRPFSW